MCHFLEFPTPCRSLPSVALTYMLSSRLESIVEIPVHFALANAQHGFFLAEEDRSRAQRHTGRLRSRSCRTKAAASRGSCSSLECRLPRETFMECRGLTRL